MTTLQDAPAARPAPAAPPAGRAVPPRFLDSLRVVAGRAKFLAVCRALFRLFALAAATWLFTALVLGSRFQLPAVLAVPLALLAWGVVLVGAVKFLRPVFRRQTLTSAARLVDAALPDTEERLSSALALAQEKDPTFRGSPELVAALIRQAEHHAEALDPAAVVSGKDVFRWFLAVCGLLAVWFVVLVVMTPNLLLGLHRTLHPFAAAQALPGPTLDVTPGDVILAQGQPLTVTVDVKPPAGLSLDTGLGEIPKATLVQHFTATSAGLPIPDRTFDMERTGPRSFRTQFDNVQHPFTYQVSTDPGAAAGGAAGGAVVGKGASKAFTVTVQPRPGVAALQLAYTFPPYTRLAPRQEASREGAIDAVAGSKVRLTLQTTQPVKTARIAVDDGTVLGTTRGQGTLDLTPVPAAENTFAVDLVVAASTQYRLLLMNADGRDNPDNNPRPITARPDAPPQVAVTSPPPTLKVRPDDTVPLHFTASDDFGISAVEVVLQVDDNPPTVRPLTIAASEQKVDADATLPLPEILAPYAVRGAREPKRITYQLKATDNRAPEPQSTLSAKQVLDLDKNTPALAQRLDKEATKNLGDALKKAAGSLKDAQNKIDDVKKADQNRALADRDAQRVADARRDLAAAREQLTAAAAQADDTRLTDLARQVRDVADGPLQRAEEEVAKAQLAGDQASPRRQSEENAARNIADAREKIDALAGAVKDAAKDQPLAQSLEQLAAQQRQLADALATNPNDPKLLEQQRQLQKKLEQLIKDNPQLQKPAADAQQAKVDDLVKKLDAIEQAQQPLADPLGQQTTATNTEKLNDLARRQQELNGDITRFAQQQAETLKQAAGKPPESSKLDPIVKNLQDNKLAQASQDQRASAAQLDNLANKLDGLQKKTDAGATARERQAAQAAEAAKDAAELQKQARDLSQQVQEAKAAGKTPNRPSDPANQVASKLADSLKREAQQLAQNPAARTQAQNASRAADAAKRAAAQGQADAAQQQLAEAANQLAQGAQAAQAAAGPPPAADKGADAAAAAAQQARDLAARQRSLAEQAAGQDKAQADAAAARTNAAATADKQQALADRLSDAARDAQALQRQTDGAAPELSQKAAQAAQALQQAAKAQADAAQSTRSLDPPAAASKQGQAAESLARAQEALTGQPHTPPSAPGAPPSPPSPPQAAGGPQPPSPPQASTPGATPSGTGGPTPAAAQNPSQSPAGDPSAGGNAPPRAGQNAPGAPSPSGAGPTDAPGQDSTPGQGGTADRGGAGRGASPTAGGNAPNSPMPGRSPIGQSTAGNNNGQPGGTPRAAGQAVQAARAAQSQAAGGDPAAARQAADQLAEASRQLMPGGAPAGGSAGGPPSAGPPGTAPPGPSAGRSGSTAAANAPPTGQTPGGSPGGGAGRGGTAGGASPGRGDTGGGGGGIVTSDNGRPIDPPKEVQDVGISPSEWAKLPPRVQDELLHSAQQAGPPGYREMIKNYYSRISRLPADSEGQK